MINSSYENITSEKDFYKVLGEVMGYYMIPGICVIAVLTNLIFCIIIIGFKKRPRFYNILLAKQIFDMFGTLIGVGWQNFHCTFCEDQVHNTYFFQFFRVYLLRFPISVIYLTSVTIDLLISHERYCKVYSKKNFMEILSVKAIVCLITVIITLLFIPDYLAIEILPTDRDNVFIHTFTKLGKTQWYNAYYLILVLIIYVGTTPLSIYINVKILKGLRHFVQKKLALVKATEKNFHKHQQSVNHQKMITVIIVTTTTLTLAIRIFHFVTLLLFKIHVLNGVKYLPSTNLMRAFGYFLLFAVYAFNLAVYLAFDKNIKKSAKQTLDSIKKTSAFLNSVQ